MMRHDLKPVIIRSEKFISFKEYERMSELCTELENSCKFEIFRKLLDIPNFWNTELHEDISGVTLRVELKCFMIGDKE